MTASELKALAQELGVRPDALEKVVRLLDILSHIDREEGVADRYALKGGTALNLFLLPLPRLSVDIDLNFIRECTPEELATLRSEFDQRLVRCVELAGCRVAFQPDDWAGGKTRLRFVSVLGGDQNLELDVSYVARVPILGTVRRHAAVPQFAAVEVTTYTLEELAAGKFAALVSRSVARDRYDAWRLLQEHPTLLSDPGFRVAFVTIVAMAREDIRVRSAQLGPLSPHDVRHQLIPLLRRSAGQDEPDPAELARTLDGVLVPTVASLLSFSAGEREFLDALMDRDDLRPDLLTGDHGLRARVAAQPMLRWKHRHVRAHLGLPPSHP